MELLKQYSIVLARLDPVVGHEMAKTRPCVILSPDELNQYLQTLIVAPLTTSLKTYPSRVSITHDGKKGWIALDQISVLDKTRILKRFSVLSQKEIKALKNVIRELLVD